MGVKAQVSPHAPQGPPTTINQQALTTDLLVVTAHPDDESMVAAVMARYADEGKAVSLVVCTRGEGGGNSTGKESGPALGAVREMELRRCLSQLGVRHLFFLNQPDWAYTESVKATLDKWGHRESLKRLVRYVRLLRPAVIVTMDPAPTGGQHGHHQAAGRLATEAFEAAANPRAFPELQLDEGLSPWRTAKLYWSGGGPNSRTAVAVDGMAKGSLLKPATSYANIARAAETSHRTQGFDRYFGSQPAAVVPKPSTFILVKSRVGNALTEEKDLFRGLDDGPPESTGTLHHGDAIPGNRASLAARLQPRIAVRDYRSWLHAQGLDRLMARLPAHASVVIGSASPVVVEVRNSSLSTQSAVVGLSVPPGWTASPRTMRVTAPPGHSNQIAFKVSVPRSVQVASYDVAISMVGGGVTDRGMLDAVPQTHIKQFAKLPAVDADPAKWVSLRAAAVPIPAGNVAQGSVYGPDEISGRFFAGYDSRAIQFLVDVTDNTVVTNIAPDDVKAHWRTTSVELCIDPSPPGENTMSTLKLGIFPADTSGRVRAARDADANPGPIDRNEPSITLASRMTRHGYVVEARIPWPALRTKSQFAPAAGRRIGVNVILYHAGKKLARIGEDINKSRLAWSFWPGVWGRPETWGIAILQ